jgi:hypothetical protein
VYQSNLARGGARDVRPRAYINTRTARTPAPPRALRVLVPTGSLDIFDWYSTGIQCEVTGTGYT